MEPFGEMGVLAPTVPLHLFEVVTETSITTEDPDERFTEATPGQ